MVSESTMTFIGTIIMVLMVYGILILGLMKLNDLQEDFDELVIDHEAFKEITNNNVITFCEMIPSCSTNEEPKAPKFFEDYGA